MIRGQSRRSVFVALVLASALMSLLAASAQAQTLTVTTTADSGPGSLRAKIAAAKPGDTVFLPASKKHYTVTSDEIKIAVAPITILGAGAGASVIDAKAAPHRVFEVTAKPAKSSTVKIQGVTITGGWASTMPGGGGILVDRVSNSIALNLTLVKAVVSANKVVVSTGMSQCCAGGGGIYSDGGDVSLVGSSVIANTTTVTGATVATNSCCDGGGGIYDNYKNISLNRSQVNGNRLTVHSPYCCHGGGGLYSDAGNATVVSSQVSNNRVTVNGSPVDAVGGAPTNCCSGGGAIYQDLLLTQVRNSTLSFNQVTINSGDCCHGGGAIFDDGTAGGAITASRLSHNSATVNGPAGRSASNQSHCCSGGGALAAFYPFTIIGSTLDANLAKLRVGDCCHGGGAIQADNSVGLEWNTYGTTISNNTATLVAGHGATRSGGGGVYEDTAARHTYSNSTFSGNSTNASGARQGGGAVFVLVVGSTRAADVLANVTLAGNRATFGSGGAILNAGAGVNTQNSIIALNHASVGANCWGFTVGSAAPVFTSLGYNLENKPDTCGFTGKGDLVVKASAVKLGPLAANGGPTLTRALLSGSPAIDHGNPTGCFDPFGRLLRTDQRGRPRPSGPRCDIGAFEFQHGKPPH